MLTREQLKVVANFLLDGAKIIFGSLVVGVFVPGASGEIPWTTFLSGIGLTITFLGISAALTKTYKTEL